jgi:hypothetical protein
VHLGAVPARVTGREPEHELPPGVDLARGDVSGDPDAAIAQGRALMATSGEAIVAAVERRGAGYVAQAALGVLDAWGRLDASVSSEAARAVEDAARAAQRRVVTELRALLVAEPGAQHHTPLQIVRTLLQEPTAVLVSLGVPPIVRDAFEERALPDDLYGLAPRSLADLGDEDAAPMMLAWGVGKATVLRAEAAKGLRTGAGHPQRDATNLSISTRRGEGERNRLAMIRRMARSVYASVRERVPRRGTGRR